MKPERVDSLASTMPVKSARDDSAADVYDQTKFQIDRFTNKTSVEGPNRYPRRSTYPRVYYHVRAVGMNIIAINCTVFADDWLFINSAYQLGGRQLRLVEHDHNVSDGSISETVSIVISEADLNAYSMTGLTVSFRGKRGSVDHSFPAYYFEGFRNRFVVHREQLPMLELED